MKRYKRYLLEAAMIAATATITACITASTVEPVEVPYEVPVEVIREVEVPKVEYTTETVYVPVAADGESFPLTDEERDLVTRVVISEAGCGTLQDMIGIAQVIRDKAEHPRQDLYHGPDIKTVLSYGHATPKSGDISAFKLAPIAVECVFDKGIRLFDETACIYFTPDKSDPEAVEMLREYKYVGETPYFEFRSDELKEDL